MALRCYLKGVTVAALVGCSEATAIGQIQWAMAVDPVSWGNAAEGWDLSPSFLKTILEIMMAMKNKVFSKPSDQKILFWQAGMLEA